MSFYSFRPMPRRKRMYSAAEEDASSGVQVEDELTAWLMTRQTRHHFFIRCPDDISLPVKKQKLLRSTNEGSFDSSTLQIPPAEEVPPQR